MNDGAATLGGFTCLPPGIRVWLDDPNPIFRMGLAASLRDPRFVVVGESTDFVPTPALENVDVLVFDLGEHDGLGDRLAPLSLSGRRRRTRLVGLVPGGDIETTERSQCTILVRSELTPESFRDCLASVAAQAPAPPPVKLKPTVSSRRQMPRLLRRKGALFAVLATLSAGAFGPPERAEGLSESPATVAATGETTPVQTDGDAAADIAVWVNSGNPSASLVLGVDKKAAALESYDLGGKRVQRIARPAGMATTVDVRNGFRLAGRTVALVGTGGKAVTFFRLDTGTRQLKDVSAKDFPTSGPTAGLCLYRSAVSGRFYAFVTEPGGDISQYELFDQGGSVDAREVRRWPLNRPARMCATDDETGRLFVSESGSGLWRYSAEPDTSPIGRQQVDRAGGGGHLASTGGVAVVTQPGRKGYLLASSPGDDTFAVYERGHNHGWLGQRRVAAGTTADGCSASAAIDAVSAGLGPNFPAGLFVCSDGTNTAPGSAGRQNFKYVRLERLLEAAGLA